MKNAAVEVLGTLEESAAPHVAAIAALLDDDNSDVRRAAVEMLGKTEKGPWGAACPSDSCATGR